MTETPGRVVVTRLEENYEPCFAVGSRPTPLKGELGDLSPWQKRNFLPLPQGQG
jgi:hypothetical protein